LFEVAVDDDVPLRCGDEIRGQRHGADVIQVANDLVSRKSDAILRPLLGLRILVHDLRRRLVDDLRRRTTATALPLSGQRRGREAQEDEDSDNGSGSVHVYLVDVDGASFAASYTILPPTMVSTDLMSLIWSAGTVR